MSILLLNRKQKKDDEYKEHVTHLKQSPSGTAIPEDAIKLYQVLYIMHEIHSVHLSFYSPLKVLELLPAVVIYSHLQVMSLFQDMEPHSTDSEMLCGHEFVFWQGGSQRACATKENTA